MPYNTGAHRSPLSWLLGAGFLGLFFRASRHDRTFLGFAAAAVLSLGVSLLISADPRDLIPAIGTLALLAGLAANHAIATLRHRTPRRLREPRLVPALCGAACLVGVWTSARYVRDFYDSNGKPPTQRLLVNGYLAAQIPCYTAVEYLNAHAASNYRAWAYDCEQTRYYAHGLLISDAFSVGSRGRVFDADGTILPDDRTLHGRLAPLRVTWMILPTRVTPNPTVLEHHRLFRFVAAAGPEAIFTITPELTSR